MLLFGKTSSNLSLFWRMRLVGSGVDILYCVGAQLGVGVVVGLDMVFQGNFSMGGGDNLPEIANNCMKQKNYRKLAKTA